MYWFVELKTMRSLLNRSMVACLLATATTTFAATPAALLGCWRGQQMDIVLADGTSYSTNSDCVTVYGESQATSRCREQDSDNFKDNSYRINSSDPSKLTMESLDSGGTRGTPHEMHYRAEGDWLQLERRNPGATGKQQASFRSVSIREQGDKLDSQACKLRGRSPLRIGRSPTSSLHLEAPMGWQAWLTDLSQNRSLAQAVGRSFLIGAFVQGTRDPGPEVPEVPEDFVLVLDDSRGGAEPVSPPRFAETRRRFAKEVGASARITCDEANRICALMTLPGNRHVYTELLNLKGRVAMVMVKASKASMSTITERARTFTSRLKSDNP